MARKVLLITVGGSDVPLVDSVDHNKPDFIYFLCSDDKDGFAGSYKTVDGDGKPCSDLRTCNHCKTTTGEARESIVKQLKLSIGDYEVVKIKHVDNVNHCYLEASRVIREIREQDPNTEIIADYTGGTKSMTAGLAAAAMDDGDVMLCVVSGKRPNLHKVEDGTQMARIIDNSRVIVEKKLLLLQKLWQDYHYQSCLSLLAEIYERPMSDDDLLDQLEKIRYLCLAFEAWDRFDHAGAHKILKREKDRVPEKYMQFLGRILRTKTNWEEILEQKQRDGKTVPDTEGEAVDKAEELSRKGEKISHMLSFDPVYDLLLNAHRRAALGRYDDAVARLYRALEMFGQLNLLRWDEPLHTGDIDIEKLPEQLRQEYETLRDPRDGTITLGLMQNYILLSRLGTPVGKVFDKQKNDLHKHLQTRNNSLMAHGITPISEADCQKMLAFVEEFIDTCCQELKEKSRFDADLQFDGVKLRLLD